jgi:sigma-B regulation protein RsbU (phosphoserine phosphatase)
MVTQMIEKEKIEKELQIAKEIQQSFLLNEDVDIAGVDVSYINIPSSEVGGDYYDIIELGADETIFTINDISGHGIPASLLMAIFRANFTYSIKKDKNMLSTVAFMNELIAETTDSNHYVTSFTCKYNSCTRLLQYINAGHTSPFLFRGKDLNAIELEAGSMVIGTFPGVAYSIVETRLKKNDILALYTDGLIEAENSAGEQFSCDRLKRFFQVNNRLDAESLKNKLIAELKEFVGKDYFIDDITFIIIKITK